MCASESLTLDRAIRTYTQSNRTTKAINDKRRGSYGTSTSIDEINDMMNFLNNVDAYLSPEEFCLLTENEIKYVTQRKSAFPHRRKNTMRPLAVQQTEGRLILRITPKMFLMRQRRKRSIQEVWRGRASNVGRREC